MKAYLINIVVFSMFIPLCWAEDKPSASQIQKNQVSEFQAKNVKEEYLFKDMLDRYNKKIELRPKSAYNYILRGNTYRSLRQYERAIEDYNKEKSVQILENRLDRFFLKHITEISTKNYVTIGPTLRFIVSKEFEIQNLKIIAKGVAENLSSDFTKKFLIMEGAV